MQKPSRTSDTTPEATGRRASLRLQITLLYIGLALLNITFFSVMVLESQMALLLKVFRFQASEREGSALVNLGEQNLSREKDEAYRKLKNGLLASNIDNFLVFDREGEIWHREISGPGAPALLSEMKEVPPRLRQLTLNFSRSSSLLNKNSESRLNENDFTVEILTMIESKNTEALFLFTVISVGEIREGRDRIYFQVGLIIFFGILFHIAFGFYLYYMIFRRVQRLKNASDNMAAGDLSARVEWDTRNADELDELGEAFNEMAGKVEEQFKTINDLNTVMTHEMEIGKEVQELFLPDSNPFEEQLQIYYRPLREVSGDIYSFFDFQERRSADRLGLFFADASGHGVSAALITSVVISFLEEIVSDTQKPEQVIMRLNEVLTQRLQANYFATGFFMLIDRRYRRIEYCNAGHLPPLVHRPSTGEIFPLTKGGPPVGMLEEFEYEPRHFDLSPGDRLLIYSDGLVEHRNQSGEEYSIERVEEMLRRHKDLPAQELFPLITSALEEWVHEYNDDVSIFLLDVP